MKLGSNKRLHHFTIYPRQVSDQTVMEIRVPSLSTRVIPRLVHQNRSQKGHFWVVADRPTICIELDQSTNKVLPGIVYSYQRCLIFASWSAVYSWHTAHAHAW